VCWFRRNDKLYRYEAGLVRAHFPKLKYYVRGEKLLILKGEIDLIHDSKLLDTYQVEILFLEDYPFSHPVAREISNRIPWIMDRHVDSKYGLFCLGPRVHVQQFWEQHRTILDFINGLVVPFLANQSFFERMGEWPNGWYAHGTPGILEFYKEEMGGSDISLIIDVLERLIANEDLGRNDKCFCGSLLKAKRCHFDNYKRLKGVLNKSVFKLDIDNLQKYQKDSRNITKEILGQDKDEINDDSNDKESANL